MEEFGADNYQYRTLFTHHADAIFALALDGTITDANAATEQKTGWPIGELRSKDWVHFLGAKSQERWRQILADFKTEGTRPHEITFRRRDGRSINLEIKIIPQMDNDSVTGWFVIGQNVTCHKALEQQLSFLACHDELSHLPNRSMFMRWLQEVQGSERYDPEHLAILYLDLDGYKSVNEMFGYSAGDAFLLSATERLRNCVPPSCLLAHMGGEEFAILHGLAGTTEAEVTAKSILDGLQLPFHIEGQQVTISPSIGVAYGTEGSDLHDVLRFADSALYEAKRQGKARYCVFDKAMGRRAVERFRLDVDLRSAVEHSAFTLDYQPIYNLHTVALESMEALVRWQHPERGIIPPEEFIALAEETGLIVPIGRWVLAAACTQLREWQDEFTELQNCRINVNISMRQLREPTFVDDVAQTLRTTGVAPHHLQLELTETMLAQDVESNSQTLRMLKALGIKLAIDDFGMGHSSLNYLKWFPVDIVKIDRAFVTDLGHNLVDEAIIRAVVTVAKSLGLIVTGEGIESAEQLKRLRQMKCDRGQGYYLGRPLPAWEVWHAGGPSAGKDRIPV